MPRKQISQAQARRTAQATLYAYNKLNEALCVIAESDNLAMATDGPVPHSREIMTNEQFDRMWKHVSQAIRVLGTARR
jgi:hypothetical protein